MPNASSGSKPVLVLATGNPGKVRELTALLAGIPFEIRTLADHPAFVLPEETGATYAENALIKARAVVAHTGALSLGDDSGVEVKALGGAPGLHSARFGGPGLDDRGRVRHLLRQVEHVPEAQRAARFVCVIALVSADGRATLVEGACDGWLTREPRGHEGFGYDPIFFYPPFAATFGEVSDERKATVSHRGLAAAAARVELIKMARFIGIATETLKARVEEISGALGFAALQGADADHLRSLYDEGEEIRAELDRRTLKAGEA